MADLPTGTVTFLFTDLEGSTRLWEAHRDAMAAAIERHDALLDVAISAHGGVVFSRMGDGVAAAFASASDAVAAAVESQVALASETWDGTGPLRARMGLHTSSVHVVGDEYESHPLNRCARLMAAAHGGQVVVSDTTAALVRDELGGGTELIDLGEHRLRDLARPMHVFQVAHPLLRRDFPALVSLDTVPGNLPLQVSSFVGREKEVTRTVAALEQSRVVTLTGVGGVGKTRLAIQVAADVAGGFRDGAWLCELAPVRDPDGVAGALAGVFNVTAGMGETITQALAEFLRGKELLLILDNCEHLLEGAASIVAALERSCPRLVVLATSREGLAIDGEWIVAVPSLRAPSPDAGVEEVMAAASVRLFVERARAVKADFVVTRENASAVAQICRRLDGLPLAIQLAAARVSAMSPAELAGKLDRRFEFLAGGRRGAVERHQTLRAAIDWSYALLSSPAQRLLDRFAVFAGGCTVDSVEAVCSGNPVEPDAIWTLLAGLVDQSLVVAEDHGDGTRYRLLETIRQYAEERLDEQGETATLRGRHAEHYLELGASLSDALVGPRFVEVAQRFLVEQDNFVAAMAWAIDTANVDLAYRLLTAYPRPQHQVGRRLMPPVEAILALPGAREHADYAFALAVAAVQAAFRGDRPRAEELSAQALEVAARGAPPDTRVEFVVSVARRVLAFSAGDWLAAAIYSEEAAGLARSAGASPSTQFGEVALELISVAQCYVMAGDLDAAAPFAAEGLDLAQRNGAPILVGMAQTALAGALAEHDPARAARLLRESIDAASALGYENIGEVTQRALVAARLRDARLTIELAALAIRHLHWAGDRPQLAGVLNIVAWAIAGSEPEAAGILQGAARALIPAELIISSDAGSEGAVRARPAAGSLITDLRREATRQVSDALGDARLRELRSQGEAMDVDQAVARALAATENAT